MIESGHPNVRILRVQFRTRVDEHTVDVLLLGPTTKNGSVWAGFAHSYAYLSLFSVKFDSYQSYWL